MAAVSAWHSQAPGAFVLDPAVLGLEGPVFSSRVACLASASVPSCYPFHFSLSTSLHTPGLLGGWLLPA